jgi:hypothetical protein
MRRERRAHGARALEDIEDAGGEARLGRISASLSAPRGVVSEGLKIIALPQASAGAAFQQANLAGVVPRADADADAERLAARVGEVAAEVDVLAPDRGGEAAEEL